jgi:hypothetical protein
LILDFQSKVLHTCSFSPQVPHFSPFYDLITRNTFGERRMPRSLSLRNVFDHAPSSSVLATKNFTSTLSRTPPPPLTYILLLIPNIS